MLFLGVVLTDREDSPDGELVVAQLFAELERICADGSWDWPSGSPAE